MTINTKQVSNRRKVNYQSYNDFLADAEQLAGTSSKTLGNWTQGQIYQHLAKSLDASIDGMSFKPPWLMVKIFSLIMKKEKMIKGRKTDRNRSEHVMFKDMTTEEWDQFNLRHAEMHMSFIQPD